MAVIARKNLLGADMEMGTFTLDGASVAAAAQGVETVTITGARVGDLIFVNEEVPVNRLVLAGAKVTANDTVSLYFNNMYDATTAVDPAVKTFNYVLVRTVVGA
jgi:hypothetical protein